MTIVSTGRIRRSLHSPFPMNDGIIDCAMYLPTETSAPLNMPA
jgi:hypothetical protein